jgi:hypothetical protein
MPRHIRVTVGSVPGLPYTSSPNDPVGISDTVAAVRTTARTLTDSIGVTDSAAGAGSIGHGSQVNATNTGIAGVGLTTGDLTNQGAITYSTAGATISRKRFTGTVTVTGANVTIQECQWDIPSGSNSKGLVVQASGVTVRNCTLRAASGSHYMSIHHSSGSNLLVDGCDASGGENIITVESDGITIDSSYLHGTSVASNPSGHADVVEIYGGNGHTITKSRLVQTIGYGDACVNVAPWYDDTPVDGLDMDDCYFSGGNSHILVDLQSTGYVRNDRVRRALMDGHTDNGRYSALQNNDGRSVVGTLAAQSSNQNAIYWPSTTGDTGNASHWTDCSDLSPDRTGQVVAP